MFCEHDLFYDFLWFIFIKDLFVFIAMIFYGLSEVKSPMDLFAKSTYLRERYPYDPQVF